MVRASAYLMVGWLLIACVGGMAEAFALTVMLPATSAVVVTHLALSRETSVAGGLAVAVGLGYLEDLHQGAPLGTLALAYGLTWLVAHRLAARLSMQSWMARVLATAAVAMLVDLFTGSILWLFAGALGVGRDALGHALWDSRFHVGATLLVAPTLWRVIDRVLVALRLDEGDGARQSMGIR